MYQTGGITETQESRHGAVVGTGTGFIAQTPGVDTGVVFVSFKHPCRPVSVNGGPLGIAADVIVEGVMFKVCFVDDVESVLIAEVVELGSRRVMAGADGVDIETLHGDDVLFQSLVGDRFAQFGVVFVAVDAVDLNSFAVDQKFPFFHLVTAESHPESRSIKDVACFIFQLGAERVKFGGFCAPAADVGQFDLSHAADPCRILTVAEHAEGVAAGHILLPRQSAVGGEKRGGDGEFWGNCAGESAKDLKIEDAGAQIFFQSGAPENIPDVAEIGVVKVDRA